MFACVCVFVSCAALLSYNNNKTKYFVSDVSFFESCACVFVCRKCYLL